MTAAKAKRDGSAHTFAESVVGGNSDRKSNLAFQGSLWQSVNNVRNKGGNLGGKPVKDSPVRHMPQEMFS
jgi:hypothetical protein